MNEVHPFSDYPGGEVIRRLTDISVAEKRVFVRVDFNVPLKNGEVTDDSRIRAALPTIQYLKEQGAIIILASHLGRPDGKVVRELSMVPVAAKLSEILEEEITIADTTTGSAVQSELTVTKPGQIVLLENLRFHPEEKNNASDFAVRLSQLCDVYVNDAFGCSHRAHCSVDALPRMMREKAAGLLLEKEISYLSKLINNPERPMVGVLGGAKVSDKIKVIEALMIKSSKLIIGGAMANTFSAACGHSVGESMMEDSKIPLAKKILQQAKDARCEIVLPIDYVANRDLKATTQPITTQDSNIPAGMAAYDIGPKSIELFIKTLAGAKTIFWNGPMGVFESEFYFRGTDAMAHAIAEHPAPIKVCGGGDSVAAINKAGVQEGFSHISTGGGASLEMLQGAPMPGIESLKNYR